MAEDLTELIESNPDSRELKRAVAVQMFLSGLKHREIQGMISQLPDVQIVMIWDGAP
jgi:transposase